MRDRSTGWPDWDEHEPSYEEELEQKITVLEAEEERNEAAVERWFELHFYNEWLLEGAKRRRIGRARERARRDPRAFNRSLWGLSRDSLTLRFRSLPSRLPLVGCSCSLRGY